MADSTITLKDGRTISVYNDEGTPCLDLYELLPDIECCYNTDYRRGKTYSQHEREVLTPALEALGLVMKGEWYSTDGDSFGPLVRGIKTDKGIVTYG